jgi:signal transduction histidine kinase
MKDLLPSAQADARPRDLGDILNEGRLNADAVSVLADIAQAMLSSPKVDLMSQALRRIFDVVRPAQRVAVIGWPDFEPLVPEEILHRDGITAGPVSTSIARRAVESRQALLFIEGRNDTLEDAPSVRANFIRSAAYVPLLKSNGDVLGLLCVDTPRDTPIMPTDFPFIRAVGALLSAAFEAESMREEARRREVEALEQQALSDALTRCMRVASHDLKTPLVVIQLAVELLTQARTEAGRNDAVEQIKRAIDRSTRLIRTYLDASAALEGRTFDIRRQNVDPHAMIDEEIEFLQTAQHGVNIANDVTIRSVSADAEKLRQIFANLLSNARKYSAAGAPIRVTSHEDENEVTFAVADRGVGIEAPDRERLFKPFQRVGDTRKVEGTGLGLWITKTMIEGHGGRIWLDSTPGVGTTIYFTIPPG